MTRVAVIGCGLIGRKRLQALPPNAAYFRSMYPSRDALSRTNANIDETDDSR